MYAYLGLGFFIAYVLLGLVWLWAELKARKALEELEERCREFEKHSRIK